MYNQNLVDWCSKITPIKLSVTKTPEELDFKNQLFKETQFLDNLIPPLKLRYYCVFNNIKNIPKCVCGQSVTYNKAYPNKGFNEYCSDYCRKNNRSLKRSFLSFLKDKEWLYEQRITQQKSKEQIAEELSCSITPINKWLKIHNIPDVKYNESNSFALTKLKDYNWLYEEHVSKHKSCEEIGNALGVSKSTISIYLAKHKIEANETNSYDRKETPSDECMEVVDFIKSFYTKPIFLDKRNIIGSLELVKLG